jgi:hypothetical protein
MLIPAIRLTADERPPAEVYACPMHPEKRVPMGRCAKCGMRLSPVYNQGGVTIGGGAHQDHEPRHGGMLTMTGNYHIEFVESETEIRLYLYDAFTKALPVRDVRSGTIHFMEEGASDYGPAVELVASQQLGCLVGRKPSSAEFKEVSVVVPYQEEVLQVSCPLRISVQGWVVDAACYASEGAAALDDRECTRAGLAGGRPAALLVGDPARPSVYLLTDKLGSSDPSAANGKLLPLIGRTVLADGKVLKRRQLSMLELTRIGPIEGNLTVETEAR